MIQGRLRICPQQMKLSKNSKFACNNIYVFVNCGNQKQRTNNSKEELDTKNPCWDDNLFFNRTNENIIFFEIIQDSGQGGRMVGAGKHSLQEVIQQGYKQVFAPVQHQNKDMGTLMMEFHFEQEGYEPIAKEKYQEAIQEFQKKQVLCKIFKYKQISEKTIKQFSKQNEELRNKLKEINDKLDRVLQRNKPKKIIKTKASDDKQLEEEIKNADSQLKFYQKELETIKKQEIVAMSVDKIMQLEAQVREKQEELQKKEEETRKAQKLIRDAEKTINNLQNESEYAKKINILTAEVKALRDKYRNMEQQLQQEEKNEKAKQEYIQKLEVRFKELCQQNSIDPQLIGQKKKEYSPNQKKINKKAMNVSQIINFDEDLQEESMPQPEEINELMILKLRNKLKVLKNTKISNERKQKIELDDMVSKLQQLDFECREIQSQVKAKEKDIHIASTRCIEMKKLLRFNQLTPLEFMQSKMRQQLQLPTQKYLLKACLACRYRSTKRDAKGGIFSSNVVPFDDADCFGSSISHRIFRVEVFYNIKNPQTIYGFQVIYIAPNEYDGQNEEIQGNLNVGYIEKENGEINSIEFTEDDSIKSINGTATDSINYLKIESIKGKVLEVGIYSAKDKPIEFKLDIGFYAMPITLFGGLDYKKTHPEGELVLVYIGAEMKNPFAPQKHNRSLDKSQLQYQSQQKADSKILIKNNETMAANSINISNEKLINE